MLPNNIAQFLFPILFCVAQKKLWHFPVRAICQPSKESQMTRFKVLNVPLLSTCTCSPINLCHHQMNTCKPPPATSTTTYFYEWTNSCTLTPCVCASGQFFELIWSDPITACFWAVWRVFSSSLLSLRQWERCVLFDGTSDVSYLKIYLQSCLNWYIHDLRRSKLTDLWVK